MMIADMLAELGHSVAGEAKDCKAGSCLHLHWASMQPFSIYCWKQIVLNRSQNCWKVRALRLLADTVPTGAQGV